MKGRGCIGDHDDFGRLLSLDHGLSVGRAKRSLRSISSVHWANRWWSPTSERLPGSIYLWSKGWTRTTCLRLHSAGLSGLLTAASLPDRIGSCKRADREKGRDQLGTARAIEMPEGEPREDRRLAGTPRRQAERSAPENPAFNPALTSIEFEDMAGRRHCAEAAAVKMLGRQAFKV